MFLKNLTRIPSMAILSSPVNTPAGICTPLSNGVKTPIHGVFYCPKKIVAPLVRIFVMVARNGQPKGWPAPLPGSANLLRVAAQSFAPLVGGYSSAMEQSL